MSPRVPAWTSPGLTATPVTTISPICASIARAPHARKARRSILPGRNLHPSPRQLFRCLSQESRLAPPQPSAPMPCRLSSLTATPPAYSASIISARSALATLAPANSAPSRETELYPSLSFRTASVMTLLLIVPTSPAMPALVFPASRATIERRHNERAPRRNFRQLHSIQ